MGEVEKNNGTAACAAGVSERGSEARQLHAGGRAPFWL